MLSLHQGLDGGGLLAADAHHDSLLVLLLLLDLGRDLGMGLRSRQGSLDDTGGNRRGDLLRCLLLLGSLPDGLGSCGSGNTLLGQPKKKM